MGEVAAEEDGHVEEAVFDVVQQSSQFDWSESGSGSVRRSLLT